MRSLSFLTIWLWSSYLSKATALLPLLCCKWPILWPKYLLGLFRSLTVPKSGQYSKAGPLQYLLQAHVRASHHSVPKEESCAPALSRTHLSYSGVENNPLENPSLLFYQLTLPTRADSRQLLSYLWKIFFMSCTVAAGASFLFPSLISGHHSSAKEWGDPRGFNSFPQPHFWGITNIDQIQTLCGFHRYICCICFHKGYKNLLLGISQLSLN